MPESTQWREALTPPYALIPGNAIRQGFEIADSDDIDLIIRFIADESKGMGHGRLRARLCRALKHVSLSSGQRRRLSDAVGRRLLSGKFSEHFFCQLRAIARIDHALLVYWCERALAESERPYVRAYAERARALPAVPVLSPRWVQTGGWQWSELPISSVKGVKPGRARWVPAHLRDAKAGADRAGEALYLALWTSWRRRRRWHELLRLSQAGAATTLRSALANFSDDEVLTEAAVALLDARERLATARRRGAIAPAAASADRRRRAMPFLAPPADQLRIALEESTRRRRRLAAAHGIYK